MTYDRDDDDESAEHIQKSAAADIELLRAARVARPQPASGWGARFGDELTNLVKDYVQRKLEPVETLQAQVKVLQNEVSTLAHLIGAMRSEIAALRKRRVRKIAIQQSDGKQACGVMFSDFEPTVEVADQ